MLICLTYNRFHNIIPPWLLKRSNCNFSLCCYDKTTTSPEVFKRKFFVLRSEFSHHVEIYTNGSKDGIRTDAAVVAANSVKIVRLPDNASIFTAEIHALDMALDIIRHTKSKDCVVFSDFLSSLQAIESCEVKNPLILKILTDHSQLVNSGEFITFCWIPSHVGISENEDADTAAKAGLNVLITNMRFPVSDLLTCVNQLCVKEWQQLWNQCTSNKLYSVQPVIGRNTSSSLSRYDTVLIYRLRIGHTRLTNSHLLKGESQPVCQACHSPLTVKNTAPVSVQHVSDILEWTHSRTFLTMLHLATSSLLLKISTFTIVYNVVLH